MKQKMLIVSMLAIFSMSLFAQTDGKKVKVLLSSATQKEMLVEQQDIVLKQDFETENLLINIYPEFKYQKILGFGAAFTETSAYNYSLLSSSSQQKLIELLFGKTGIGFDFCRTHIHSCDFAIDRYT